MKERVLIVDDSPEIRNFLAEYILKPRGFEVLTATNGLEGLTLAVSKKPQLMIVDIQMPRLNGLDLLQRLRDRGLDIPAILMTGHGSEAVAVTAFRLGVRDYMIKPFDMEEMERAIDRALREGRLKQERDALLQQLAEQEEKAVQERVWQQTEIVSLLSKDLRSPLTVLLGYSELLNDEMGLNGEKKVYLGRIHQHVKHIILLVENLQKIEKLEKGELDLQEMCDLGEMWQQVLMINQPALKEQGIRVANEMPATPITIFGDKSLLYSAIAHLLDNAIKFNRPNGKIGCVLCEEDGYVMLEITDTGRGIPRTAQSQIFHKFFRAENVTTDTHGNGLGLALVKLVVERHKGEISVQSVEGKGTIMTVKLPVNSYVS